MTTPGKGSRRRPEDEGDYGAGWDRVFGPKSEAEMAAKMMGQAMREMPTVDDLLRNIRAAFGGDNEDDLEREPP